MFAAMPDPLAIILRPVAAVLLFGLAVLLARALRRVIPAGRIKRWLYTPHAIIPSNEAERRDLTAPLVLIGGVLAVLILAALYMR
jgi:hypothetical protein